jgi:hypothetical protein
VTFREDATQALAEGRAAEVGASNPYSGKSVALAGMWRRGYGQMLLERVYMSPGMQPYLRARTERDGTNAG